MQRIQTHSRPSLRRIILSYLLFTLVLFCCFSVPIGFIIYMPGNVYPLSEMIEVPHGVTGEGCFLMTVVLSQQANIPLYLRGLLTPGIDVYPIAQVRPTSVSEEEYQIQMLQSMLTSQEVATGLALRHLGYEVAEMGDGISVLGFTEGNKSSTVLRVGDTIIACEDRPVRVNSELSAILRTKVPGETIALIVRRGEEELRFLIELVPRLDNPEIGAIGVTVSNLNWHLDLPVEVTVLSADIGGSSAGLMMTLEIINQLSPDDLSAGKRIAGTGTIDLSGTVGAIGGVRQKVIGAINNGADYFLTPVANFDAAYGAAANRIEVIAVANLAEALAFLGGLK